MSVAKGAIELLNSDKLRLQRMGVRLLKSHPDSAALDRLWQLLELWVKTTETNENEPGRSVPNIHDRFEVSKAMAKCVADAPQWLEKTIIEANACREPVHELVYLLPKLRDGDPVWHAVKELVFKRVPPSKERSLAVCLLHFHDTSHLNWLRERIHRRDGLLGPMVRKALSVLDPESQLEPFARPVDWEHYSTRAWWLPSIQLRDPGLVEEFVRESFEQSKEPWEAAHLFSGRETWAPRSVIEILFFRLEDLLRRELAQPSEPNKVPLYAPLSFLSSVAHPNQFELFWQLAGTELENLLVEWLLRQGPNETRCVRLVPDVAFRLLTKIAGPGVVKVGAMYLTEGEDFLAREPGFECAMRRPEEELLDYVATLAVLEEEDATSGSDSFPLTQQRALEVLASAKGHDEALVAGILRCGLKTSVDLEDFLAGRVLDETAIEPSFEALRKRPTPEAALVLGLSGRREFAETVRAVLPTPLDESDLSLACIVALQLLRDLSQKTIDVLAAALDQPRLRHPALVALLSAPNEDLNALFLERLQTGETGRIARLLLRQESTRLGVARTLWDSHEPARLVFELGPEVEFLAAHESEEVHDFFVKAAYSGANSFLRSSRAAAIRGLARIDRADATRAANQLLHDGSDQEKREAVAIAYDLDAVRAVEDWSRTISRSSDLLLIHAIGEKLDEDTSPAIKKWLASPDPATREGACMAIWPFAWNQDLDSSLASLLSDRSQRVRDEAWLALEFIREDRLARQAIGRIGEEPQRARRWALVDAAIALGNPGVVAGRGQHNWFSELSRELPYYLVDHALDRLKGSRKELIQRLEQRQRNHTRND